MGRVLLVNTNRMQPPIAPVALDYIADALRTAGHEAALLDFCLAADPKADADAAFGTMRPDLVGLTFRNTDDCYFASRKTFAATLKADVATIRARHTGPIVVGGAGFSVKPKTFLDYCGADYGARGDGETTMPALLEALAGRLPLEQVPGLIYREGGAWRENPPGYADLGQMALSRRDLADNAAYFARSGQLGVETSRGCPGRCVYCADPLIKGRALRLRSPADVAAEMQNLLERGIDHFHLCDSEFNLPPSHATAVCRTIIDAGLRRRIRWHAYASPIPCDEKLLLLMKRAGCAGINFGVDSGCDAQLEALGREHRAADLVKLGRMCREAELVFMFDLLLGGPGETSATLAETIALMREIGPDCVGVSLGVGVCPGGELEARLRAEGASIAGDPAGLEPAYYMSPALGPDPARLPRELIGDDPRFFLPGGGDESDYNYNNNRALLDAIAAGYRGAYWDILRRLRLGIPPT